MGHDVAAIVEHHIGDAELVDHRAQEASVALVADAHQDLVLGKGRALWPHIQADDDRVRAEKLRPELQRAAFAATNLNKHHRSTYEAREVALVDREVVLPLVGDPPVMVEEQRPERHGAGVLHARPSITPACPANVSPANGLCTVASDYSSSASGSSISFLNSCRNWAPSAPSTTR